jgi:hypothetical protein
MSNTEHGVWPEEQRTWSLGGPAINWNRPTVVIWGITAIPRPICRSPTIRTRELRRFLTQELLLRSPKPAPGLSDFLKNDFIPFAETKHSAKPNCGCAVEPSGAVREAQCEHQHSSQGSARANADVLLRQEPSDEEDEEQDDDRKQEDGYDDEDDGYSE